MKKSLSVVLSSALVLSMFGAVAANADEMTAQQKFDALKDKGIFAGVNANGDAGLDQNMTRAEFARIAGLLDGLNVDATPASQTFKDVAPGNWAYEEVEAAAKAGLIQGYGNGIYNPKGNVKVEDMAIVLDKILGLQVDDAAKVDGADAYAQKYVKAAIDAGILSADTNFKAAATREQLVTSSYSTYEQANVADLAITASATGAKKLTVNFNQAVDSSKATISVWNVNNQVNAKSVTFSDDKKSATIEFANNLAAADYTVKVEGLSDSALTAKVTVEAEKAAKIEFNSDKAALVRGNSKEVTVGYKVLNQYGEDVTSSYSVTPSAGKGTPQANSISSGTITLTSTSDYVLGETFAVSLVNSNGTFASQTVTVSPVAQVASLNITKVYQKDNKDLQVGVDLASNPFYLVVDAKDQYGNSVTDTTYLNNGADVIATVSNPDAVSVQGYDSTANTATFQYMDVDGDGTSELVLPLAVKPGNADLKSGTSTVTLISKTSGSRATQDLTVKDSVKVANLTLSAPSVAVAGETVTIPYTAVDQFGKAIDNPTDAMVTSRDASGTANDPHFVKDYVSGKTNLQLDLSDVHAASTVIVTIITGTNDVKQLTLNVVDPAKATVASGVKNFDLGILNGGTVSVGTGNVVVKDQYNRDFTPTYANAADTGATADGKYRIAVSSANTGVITAGSYIYADSSSTLTSVAKGSSAITLKLQKYNNASTAADKWEDVPNSSYIFTEKVVDKADIQSYDAAVAGTVYSGAATPTDYAKALTVKGTLADGSTVTVTNSVYNYVVTPTVTTGFNYDTTTGKFSADSTFDYGDATTTSKDVGVVVSIKGATTAETKTVTVKVSKDPSAVATLSTPDVGTTVGVAKVEDTNVVSVAQTDILGAGKLTDFAANAVKAVDQYGIELTGATEPAYTLVATALPTGAAVTYDSVTHKYSITGVAQGDSFSLAAVTTNGKAITLKVVVK